MSRFKAVLDSPSLRLLEREAAGERIKFLLLALGAGVANSLVLAVINDAAGAVGPSEARVNELVIFVAALAVYAICLTRLFQRTAQVFEDAIDKIRKRLVVKIRRSDLRALEGVGKSVVYNRLTLDTATISQSQGIVTTAFQSAVMVLFIVLYMAFLSLPAFAISVVLVAGGFYIHARKQAAVLAAYRRTAQVQVEYFSQVSFLLDGFKEVKLNRRRGRDLSDDLGVTSEQLRGLTLETFSAYHSGYIFSQAFFYVLLAVLVFVFPRVVPQVSDVATDLTSTVLFLVGPLTAVVSSIPAFTKINVAIENIYALERRLDAEVATQTIQEDVDLDLAPMMVTRSIKLSDLAFRYFDAEKQVLFGVGPLDFEIRRGEITFIVGGNGSGKSTIMKLLCGLYAPERGRLLADDVPIGPENLANYQACFSTIFSDFQLFKKLYGLLDTDPLVVQGLIDKLGLTNKTKFVHPAFTRTDLSTGQRKRIALIVALLEDRPVAVFDEVAADQDSTFRAHFYRVLLPELRAAGKTIIVVSHDDRYFDVADQVIKLELGQVQEIRDQRTPQG